jgi:hypothetical protein
MFRQQYRISAQSLKRLLGKSSGFFRYKFAESFAGHSFQPTRDSICILDPKEPIDFSTKLAELNDTESFDNIPDTLVDVHTKTSLHQAISEQ